MRSVLDYLFGWTYNENFTLPLETYMTCTWDNGSAEPNNGRFNLTAPLLAPSKKIYNIPHNFSAAGYYTIHCNMSNFVSSQLLQFNVRYS
jgi:hypothetical protein